MQHNIEPHVVIELRKQIKLILDFASGKSKEYKYIDLSTGVETVYTDLKGFPCEFFLLLGNKHLCGKTRNKEGRLVINKNCLNDDIENFLFKINPEWHSFTGSHLVPIPSHFYPDTAKYNAQLVHTYAKAAGTLWMKEFGVLRQDYLAYVLARLS